MNYKPGDKLNNFYSERTKENKDKVINNTYIEINKDRLV